MFILLITACNFVRKAVVSVACRPIQRGTMATMIRPDQKPTMGSLKCMGVYARRHLQRIKLCWALMVLRLSQRHYETST